MKLSWTKLTVIFIGLFIIHLLILTRLQFTAWPEVFAYPFLLNHGFKLYQDFALPYQPLLTYILAPIYSIFGYQILTLKIFTFGVIILSDLLVLLISLKIVGQKWITLLPLIFYVLLQPLMDGNQLWFDLGTVPFLLLGIYLLLIIKTNARYFWLGFLLCLACLVKQQEAVAAPLIFILLAFEKKWRPTFLFVVGGLVPLLAVTFYQLAINTFGSFLFWTVAVPVYWYPQFPGYTQLPNKIELIETMLVFGPIIFWSIFKWKKIDENLKIIFLIFIGILVTAFARFEFFRFQEALAVATISGTYFLTQKNPRTMISLGGLLAVLVFFIRADFGNFPDRFYGPQEIKFASTIDSLTGINDRIYLLGDQSLYYVLSNRLPPKPWVDNYVWYMEIPGIQQQVLNGFMNEPPKIIIWKTPQSGNWFDNGTYQPQQLVKYIKANYHQINLIGEDQIWQRN